jgi:cytochrome subunit of sulfide dehydrogenase
MSVPRLVQVTLLLTVGVLQQARAADPRGEALADGCTSCHGIEGRSHGYIPSLNKLSRAEFVQAMRDFRAQKRSATIMDRIVRVYSDEEVALLADYYAAGSNP